MSKLANVWVFSDNVERYAELMAGARLWGEQVHLIVQGSDQANQLQALGADKIVVLGRNLRFNSVLKITLRPSPP